MSEKSSSKMLLTWLPGMVPGMVPAAGTAGRVTAGAATAVGVPA